MGLTSVTVCVAPGMPYIHWIGNGGALMRAELLIVVERVMIGPHTVVLLSMSKSLTMYIAPWKFTWLPISPPIVVVDDSETREPATKTMRSSCGFQVESQAGTPHMSARFLIRT